MKGRALVALLLAVVVLLLFILAVGWQEVYSAASEASLTIFALAFVAAGVMLVSRSIVWHLVLGVVDQRRPYWLVSSVFLTAMFAKYVTPYGQIAAGVGTAAIVSRYYESVYEESLAAILSADFINYLPYYSFGAIGLAYFLMVDTLPFNPTEYVPTAGIVIAVLVLGLALLWWGRRHLLSTIERARRVAQTIIGRVSPAWAAALSRENLIRRIQGFSSTIVLLRRDRRTMFAALLWGHIAWLGLAGALYFSALAVGHQLPIGLVFLGVALSKLGFILPTPGGVGGVEIALAGVLFLITPMGGAVATATAILYRFSTYWFTVFLGGCSSIALTVSDPTPP